MKIILCNSLNRKRQEGRIPLVFLIFVGGTAAFLFSVYIVQRDLTKVFWVAFSLSFSYGIFPSEWGRLWQKAIEREKRLTKMSF